VSSSPCTDCLHFVAAALLASKTRLSEMYALEGLYCEARDELGRLDKENLELKSMWQQGVEELGRSRCACVYVCVWLGNMCFGI